MTVMAFGLLIQLLPLGLLIWVIREVWRKGKRDSGKNDGRPYSQPGRPSRSGQMWQAYGQAARNRQARQSNTWQNMPGQNRAARQSYNRQSMSGQNRQAWQSNSRQNMSGQNRAARQAYNRQNMSGQNRAARQSNSRQSEPSRNKTAQQAYARQSQNEARMRAEVPEGSALMDKVYDLMITGYNGNLKFERDFLAEGMDMLAKYSVQG